VYVAEVAVNHEPFHDDARRLAAEKTAPEPVKKGSKSPKPKEPKPVKASQAHVEYKYVLGDPAGDMFQWEGGENRVLDWSILDAQGNDAAAVLTVREAGLGFDRKDRVLSNVARQN